MGLRGLRLPGAERHRGQVVAYAPRKLGPTLYLEEAARAEATPVGGLHRQMQHDLLTPLVRALCDGVAVSQLRQDRVGQRTWQVQRLLAQVEAVSQVVDDDGDAHR